LANGFGSAFSLRRLSRRSVAVSRFAFIRKVQEVRILSHALKGLPYALDVFRRRRRRLCPALAQEPFVDFTKMGKVLPRIVVESSVDRAAEFVQLVQSLVDPIPWFTHGILANRSCGVTSSGTCRLSAVLIRRMCTALFGFAKCLESHVTMKSQ
jgi:hypothetical protein